MEIIDLNTNEGRNQFAWLFADKAPAKKKKRKKAKASPAKPTERQIQKAIRLADQRGKINMDVIREKLGCSWRMSALIKKELIERQLIARTHR